MKLTAGDKVDLVCGKCGETHNWTVYRNDEADSRVWVRVEPVGATQECGNAAMGVLRKDLGKAE